MPMQVDLRYDTRLLSIASVINGYNSRESYFSQLLGKLCQPGSGGCSPVDRVPSCVFELNGGALTEHQKQQLDVFHLQTAPDEPWAEPNNCDDPALTAISRRTGSDGTVIPQCKWKESALDFPEMVRGQVETILLGSQVARKPQVEFFVAVAAKSTVFLGGMHVGELTARALNVSVSLVQYNPELFATGPLSPADAAGQALYLELESENGEPGALAFASPSTGEIIPTEQGSDGRHRVQLEFVPVTAEYSVTFLPAANRVTFKADRLFVAPLMVQLNPAGAWLFVQPWYGSKAKPLNEANEVTFQNQFLPYTYIDIGAGVLPIDCNFPSASAIRDSGMSLALALTGGARVRFIVLPEPLPPGTRPPTLDEVNDMQVCSCARRGCERCLAMPTVLFIADRQTPAANHLLFSRLIFGTCLLGKLLGSGAVHARAHKGCGERVALPHVCVIRCIMNM